MPTLLPVHALRMNVVSWYPAFKEAHQCSTLNCSMRCDTGLFKMPFGKDRKQSSLRAVGFRFSITPDKIRRSHAQDSQENCAQEQLLVCALQYPSFAEGILSHLS